MADIKDILGVARTAPAGPLDAVPGPKPKERPEARPKGMSREAYALLQGSHPLVPSQLVGDIRKKSELQVSQGRCSQRS